MFALTNNVVQGQGARRRPRTRRCRSGSARSCCAACARPPASASRRWATLLDALGKNPATHAAEAWRSPSRRRCCRSALARRHPAEPGGPPGGVRRRAGEAGRRLGADGVRASPSRRGTRAIKRAFLHTGKSYAARRATRPSARVLTGYAQSWANMYEEACEATQVRGEQSAEVLDLRMSCLQERLGGLRALTRRVQRRERRGRRERRQRGQRARRRWIAAPTCRCCGRSCGRPRIRRRARRSPSCAAGWRS